MENLVELSEKEKLEIIGGVFGVDDAIFWGLLCTGFATGAKLEMNRKNRAVKERKN